MMKTVYKAFHTLALLSCIWFLFDCGLEQWAEPYAKDDIDELENKEVALVLGASLHLKNGQLNYYLTSRLDATVELYKKGKIKYIVVSGDNSRVSYNEPKDMKEYLMRNGVPEKVIYCDYAGFRTLDSVVRCKAIFCAEDVVIVSQEFHNIRALALAKANGVDAIAYNADTYGNGHVIREKLARVKMAMDILFGVGPKYYGEPICIGQS